MDPFAIAAVAGSVVNVVGGLRSSKKAKKAGKRQARAIMEEARVEQLQQRAQGKQEIGLAKATAGAAGVRQSGSTGAYISSMEAQLQRRLDWIEESAKRRARIAKKGGSVQASALKWGALSSGLSGIGSMKSMFGGGGGE